MQIEPNKLYIFTRSCNEVHVTALAQPYRGQAM